MAATTLETKEAHRITYTTTITADGSPTIQLPNVPVRSMSIQSDGADGGGTLTWLVSNTSGGTFAAVGLSTATDPANPVAVTSATAAGVWTFHDHDLSYSYLRFTLTGATNPTAPGLSRRGPRLSPSRRSAGRYLIPLPGGPPGEAELRPLGPRLSLPAGLARVPLRR